MEERPEGLLQSHSLQVRLQGGESFPYSNMGTEPRGSEIMTQGAWEVAGRRTGGEGKVG